MRFSCYRFLLLSVLTVISLQSFAQKPVEYKKPRILLLLDGSSSMVNTWANGKTRFKAAEEIILQLMDSVSRFNSQVEFSLRVYGHEHGVGEKNCFDTKQEVGFNRGNLTQMGLRLASLHPQGVSPIAYSLKVAAENDFSEEGDYAYSLILITDGGESCGGDICAVVKALLDKKIEFKPYIISLVDYAPLKDQYACLGNYLQAAKPSELPQVINTISGNYRRVFAVPIARTKLETPKTTVSTVTKVLVPAVNIPKPEDEPRKRESLTALPSVRKRTLPMLSVVVPPMKRLPKPGGVKLPVKEAEPAPIVLKRDRFTPLKPRSYTIMGTFWRVGDSPRRRVVPKLYMPPKENAPVAAVPQKTPPAKAVPKTIIIKSDITERAEKKEATFTTRTEKTSETLLEVVFTDGKGKIFHSTPQIELVDPVTGQQVKRFYRTIDASGNPDPQKVPAGKYTMLIGKSGNYITRNVVIEADNRNRVTVVVTHGTLGFVYDPNPKRPPSEFVATVKMNFEPGPTMVQKCTEEKEYSPGNYHIEINTLPVSRWMIDLEFGTVSTITIDEPGFVKFTNTTPLGKAGLFFQDGDQFSLFYTMNITGDPEAQKLRLKPGYYQVRWQTADTRAGGDMMRQFLVRSNDTASVELK